MKVLTFRKSLLCDYDREALENAIAVNNMKNGRILAVIAVIIEVLLQAGALLYALLKLDSSFSIGTYAAVYLLLIAVSLAFLFVTRGYDKHGAHSKQMKSRIECAVVAYASFLMIWGSFVSLLDQKLYGHLITFMANMIVCSVAFLFEKREYVIPFSVSSIVIIVGLPFFQFSMNVLIGHYVSILIFVVISWFASRVIYHSYCNNFISMKQLNETNILLAKKVDENNEINRKLLIANARLKNFAMFDELTGIPNRRYFREFIDLAFERFICSGSTIAIIMTDIDLFKKYNDMYGHEKGDKALAAIAKQLSCIAKDPDEIIVRWGGEEFVYASFNRPKSEINEKAALINSKIADLHIALGEDPDKYLTVSTGICIIPIKAKSDVGRALALADNALYHAKSCGRNCIRTADDIRAVSPGI